MLMNLKNVDKNGITSTIETLTPSQCKNFLERNSHNREVRPATVRLYSKQMKNSEWEINGEPIIIADNGDVMDGQHRMLACIDADIPFTTLVVRNINRSMFHTIDTGKVRNGSDVLTINGLSPEIARTCSTASAFCLTFDAFGTTNSGAHGTYLTTPAKRSDWVLKNQRIITIAEKIHSFGRYRLLSAGQIAFLWFFMEKQNMDATNDFFEGFLSGANLAENDTRLILRTRLESQKSASRKWDARAKMGATIRAWDWFCRGRSTKYPNNIFHDLSNAFDLLKRR